MPLQAPELAAAELRRAMTKLGLRGAMIGTNVNGRNLDDPALAPFWAAAEELGAFIFIHPHGGGVGERLSSYYLKNFVGLPFETTIAAATLVFGGVLGASSETENLPVAWRRFRALSGRAFPARL